MFTKVDVKDNLSGKTLKDRSRDRDCFDMNTCFLRLLLRSQLRRFRNYTVERGVCSDRTAFGALEWDEVRNK